MALRRLGGQMLGSAVNRRCNAVCETSSFAVLRASQTAEHVSGQPAPASGLAVLLSAGQRHLFRSGSRVEGVNVEIQSMGESITEGSIAEILKQQGDSVNEDEVIAQIETDKVTIDIKAPVAGKLAELRIQTDDTVKVGQVVAVIAEGEGGESTSKSADSNDAETPEKAEEASRSSEPTKSASDKPSAAAEDESREDSSQAGPPARKPSIRFPQRMTPEGKRVSDLSADERERVLGGDGSHKPEPPQSQPDKSQPEQKPSSLPWYAGKEQGTKLSQSRVLSQREMEQIELGGADP